MADIKPDLIRDIDFALRQKVRLPKGVRWPDEISSQVAARAIAEQLLRANWRIERGPPAAPHSAPPPGRR